MRNITIEPREPSQPGALSGWVVVCSDCGENGGASLEGMAEKQAMDHANWHNRRDEAKRREMNEAVVESVHEDLENAFFPNHQGDEDHLSAVGRVGLYMFTLLNPEDPEAADQGSVREGVERFLKALQGEG